MSDTPNNETDGDRKKAADKVRQAVTFARNREQELTAFQRKESLSELQSNEFFRSLQIELFRAINPIPTTITNTILNFYNQMTPVQRKTLSDIGASFASLPFAWLSGEKTAEECYKTCVKGIEALTNFFVENPDILLKAGTAFLTALVPLGTFLGKSISDVLTSGLDDKYKQPLTRAFNSILNALDSLINKVEATPKKEPKYGA
jgi:hypothetical protein